jgi:bifunctional DNA-binding transcriptional regulator/antitoxin component of YhaV-PrlF toxin-antitoxin module
VLMQTQEFSLETYPVRLRKRGQITVPPAIRKSLAADEGEFLVWVRLGDMVLLVSKEPKTLRLTEKLSELMDDAGVTLADLLQGLEEERVALWKERNT